MPVSLPRQGVCSLQHKQTWSYKACVSAHYRTPSHYAGVSLVSCVQYCTVRDLQLCCRHHLVLAAPVSRLAWCLPTQCPTVVRVTDCCQSDSSVFKVQNTVCRITDCFGVTVVTVSWLVWSWGAVRHRLNPLFSCFLVEGSRLSSPLTGRVEILNHSKETNWFDCTTDSTRPIETVSHSTARSQW